MLHCVQGKCKCTGDGCALGEVYHLSAPQDTKQSSSPSTRKLSAVDKEDLRLVLNSLQKHAFLLHSTPLGTFREEERLRLSDKNSILMTKNLSRIRSEVLIGREHHFA